MSWQHHKHCHSYYYYYYYYLLDLRPRPFCLALKHTVFIADITVKPTRQACCCLNVNEYLFYEHVYPVLTWRRHTSQSTERRRHPLLVVVTWDLPTLARSSFLARGQVKDKSNLACRLITRGTNERNVKIGQRGSERGHVTFEILGPSPYLWNSWS